MSDLVDCIVVGAGVGWFSLDKEARGLLATVFGVLSTLGVAMAVLGRAGRSGGHRFEAVQGSTVIAACYGLIAAAGQAHVHRGNQHTAGSAFERLP